MYRVVFTKNNQLVRKTILRFYDWNNAQFWLTKILKFKSDGTGSFVKHDLKAEIVAANGIPF